MNSKGNGYLGTLHIVVMSSMVSYSISQIIEYET